MSICDPNPSVFLSLPIEVSEQIIVSSDPQGAVRLAQCSKALHSLIFRQSDNHIWRTFFLSLFDDPRTGSASQHYDWLAGMRRRLKAQNVFQSMRRLEAVRDCKPTKGGDLDREFDITRACHVCVAILRSARPGSIDEPYSGSLNLKWLHDNIGDYTIYLWPWVIAAEDLTQDNDDDFQEIDDVWPQPTSAYLTNHGPRLRLASLAGCKNYPNEPSDQDSTRLAARAFVYDLRNYRTETEWGPWMLSEMDGERGRTSRHDIRPKRNRVNWLHFHAILTVVWANVDEYGGQFSELNPPMGYLETRPYSAPGLHNCGPGDWAGVQGRWKRIVCFVDYRDLEQYNFAQDVREDVPLDQTIFQDPDFTEAVRLLHLELRVDSIEDPKAATTIDPRRPTIHFKGTSRGGSPNESKVFGTVSVTHSGSVRWHLVDRYGVEISNYDGEDRWMSSGVQAGGVGSAMGVLGTWTSFEHEARDPAGPFWLWKIA